jgi:hypothetical protein
VPIVADIKEPEVRAGADPRLRFLAELSTTLLTGIVETGESVKSGRENTIDCPADNGVFPPAMAFLSSSTFEVSFPPLFPSSETR